MVLSTLHTNDAVSSIVRLEDMGVETYLVANSLVGLVAQRLVRKVCPHCARQMETTEQERLFLGEDVRVVTREPDVPSVITPDIKVGSQFMKSLRSTMISEG